MISVEAKKEEKKKVTKVTIRDILRDSEILAEALAESEIVIVTNGYASTILRSEDVIAVDVVPSDPLIIIYMRNGEKIEYDEA